ncbi:MAG TPA: hypothetical protein VNX21_09720 [Candidatus Thermoplasmatota archaeon]|nr:hypothetical protein [Candidatus Thermoplasmatota archaeon]
MAAAAPVALLAAEAARLASGWDWSASLPARVALGVLALASLAAALVGPRRLEGRDLEEARALHAEATAAFDRAARALESAEALQAKAARPRPLRWRPALLAAIPLAFLLAAGGLWAVAFPGAEAQAVHEHARFAVYVEGERLDYGLPVFDLAARGDLRGHLHAPDGETLHVEGPPGLTFGAFFERTLLGELGPGRVRLDAEAHGGRAFDAEQGVPIRLLVSPRGEVWREALDPAAHAPRDGDRILLVVGRAPETLPPWAWDAPDLNPTAAAP